jgi:uncharacterized protein involved in exopolysaccharide biosynthesis
MSDQITEKEFYLSQRIESLARQNAQQALRISDLEAQISLIRAQSQQQNASFDQIKEEADKV